MIHAPPRGRPARALILFDIDGTLMSSGGAGSAAFVEALSVTFGVTVDASDFSFGGRTDAGIATDLLARHGIAHESWRSASERLWREYLPRLERAMSTQRPRLYDGVWELLERLARRSDVLLGVLTGNHEPAAWRKLEAVGIGGYFRLGAFGGASISRLDLPALALSAARPILREPVTCRRTIVVGDTPHDIDCARHAGMRALAVATGRYDLDTLRAHAPDRLHPTLVHTADVLGDIDALLHDEDPGDRGLA